MSDSKYSKPSSPLAYRVMSIAILQALAAVSSAQAAEPAQEVTVSGQRASLRKAIAIQEKADHIVSAVSADDIGGLPDKNAAEALARLPGLAVQRDQGEGRYVVVRGLAPDLNSVSINGNQIPSPEASRRAVALDILPAGMIRSLEVSKTLRPEHDAGALGGNVEVKTLSAFDLPGAMLNAYTGLSYDGASGKTSPNAGALWAQRFMSGKLGVAMGLSAEKRSFASDNIETGGSWQDGKLGSVELRDYLPVRERHALALNMDYRPDANQQTSLRYFLSDFSDDEVRDRLTFSNFASGTLAENASTSARAERRLRQRKYTQTLQSLNIASEWKFGDSWLKIAAATSRASEDTPESINDARFRGTANFSGISFTNTEQPRISAPESVYTPASYNLNSITLQQRYSSDRMQQFQTDFRKTLQAGDSDISLQAGIKFSRRDKDNDTNQWAYNSSKSGSPNYWGAGSVSLADFTGGMLDYPVGRIGAGISPDLIRARVAGLNRDAAKLANESAINDYRMQENLDAAYLQVSWDRHAWHLTAGSRLERTHFSASGKQISAGQITDLQKQRDYQNWLPSVHARYDFDQQTSLRAAWTSALVRANFSQLAPGTNLISNTEAQIGNPDLQAMTARGLDLGVEKLLAHDGVVSAYLFHKDVRNFTYTTNLAGSAAWKNYSSVVSYANGGDGTLNGLELAYSQPLKMLPAPWNNLILGANYTFVRSDAEIGRYDSTSGKFLNRSIRLPGQADRLLNLSIAYEQGPWSARLALNSKSEYLLELGSDILNPAQDRIVAPQKQIDLSLSWQFAKRWSLLFEAANLNNEKYYVYQGSPAYNAQYEQYGRSYKLSLKASLM
ncbi:TonB-dependent receptor [Undibacterium squillarum]|nr:TonB-dependent receptor [Undibacterium squillarum]